MVVFIGFRRILGRSGLPGLHGLRKRAAAVRASEGLLAGVEWARISAAFSLVVAYNVIFLAVAYMTFDYLVEE